MKRTSDKVVLMIAKLQSVKKKNVMCWSGKHYKAVADAKNSVINKNNSHYGSKGLHFSFGNKGQYKMVHNSSVGQYAMKQGISDEKKLKCLVIEELVARELKDGINNIGRVLPNFNELIAPVLKIADDLQSILGHINLQNDKLNEYGIWKSVIAINSETDELHTEHDCSYTVITVPKQDAMLSERHYNFLFSLNSSEYIALPMTDPMSFIFSAKFLMHRQFCNGDHMKRNDYFFNFGSYCNEKLFNHVKKSLNRIKKL